MLLRELIYIALNELHYSIHVLKDSVVACYWIEWIIEFDIEVRNSRSSMYICRLAHKNS